MRSAWVYNRGRNTIGFQEWGAGDGEDAEAEGRTGRWDITGAELKGWSASGLQWE